MNQRREIVYKYRDEVLEGRDMGPVAREEIEGVIGQLVDQYTPSDYIEESDLDELWVQLDQIFHVDFGPDELDTEAVDREELKRLLAEDALKLYDERESELGEELMRALERYLLLQIIDQRWREHLYDIDYLREGIHLRGPAQIEPIIAYKNEAFALFQDLMHTVWSDFARMVYNVQVEIEGENVGPERHRVASRQPSLEYSGGTAEDQPNMLGSGPARRSRSRRGAAAPGRRERAARPQRPVLVRVGQKFKKCHGAGV